MNTTATVLADFELPGDFPSTFTGQHVVKFDEMSHATHYLYDLAGRLTDVWLPKVDDAETSSTALVYPHWQYTYDANGNQSSQVDPKGHTTSFKYDELGRRTERKLPLNQTETSAYDSFGRLNQSVDFKGNTTVYVYYDSGDNAGRLQYKRYFTPGQALNTTPNQEVQYAYDSLGRTDTVTERAAGTTIRTTAYGYDTESRTILESLARRDPNDIACASGFHCDLDDPLLASTHTTRAAAQGPKTTGALPGVRV